MMKLPVNSENFKEIVLEKIRTYCDTNIWPFEYDYFAAWLNNFDCPIEEYLALQMLDNLIVRSNEMARSSYSRLINCEILSLLNERKVVENLSIWKWKERLKSGALNGIIRFCPVKLKNDQGESGGVIYRLMSQQLNTDRYAFSKAQNPPRVIILVDDFIGSGDQFKDFAKEFNLSEKLEKSIVIYCPLIAFEDGIIEVSKEFENLVILPCEKIYRNDGFFFGEDNDSFKNDQQNTHKEVKDFFFNMKEKYGKDISNWFGYKDAALPLAFEWGCPNQTPAVLYMDYSKQRKGWNKLFSRRA
ncbi:conserved hypothetical protein [Alteromonas macleodii]